RRRATYLEECSLVVIGFALGHRAVVVGLHGEHGGAVDARRRGPEAADRLALARPEDLRRLAPTPLGASGVQADAEPRRDVAGAAVADWGVQGSAADAAAEVVRGARGEVTDDIPVLGSGHVLAVVVELRVIPVVLPGARLRDGPVVV